MTAVSSNNDEFDDYDITIRKGYNDSKKTYHDHYQEKPQRYEHQHSRWGWAIYRNRNVEVAVNKYSRQTGEFQHRIIAIAG